MSYAELRTEDVKLACYRARIDLQDSRRARVQRLVREKVRAARRGPLGIRWLGCDLSEEHALSALENGDIMERMELSAARMAGDEELRRVARLHRLASDTAAQTMMVSAEDFDAIALHFRRGAP
jgi:hypothetical protein